jgi:hypothetical protein
LLTFRWYAASIMRNCIVRFIYIIVVVQTIITRNSIVVVVNTVVNITAIVTIIGRRTIQYDNRWLNIVT